MIQFSDEHTEGGVTRRAFDLTVAGERVPALLWAPQDAQGPRPLVLAAHGGSQSKTAPGIVSRAVDYAKRFGYATLALDSPGHGERVTPEQAEAFRREVSTRVAAPAGPGGMSAELVARMAKVIQQAAPEWKAALDAVQGLDFVGANGPVGFWGVSMATAIGICLVAEEPRIRAAVFGLAGLRAEAAYLEAAARKVTVPVQFVVQWDDKLVPREQGLALFDAFGAAEKSMHVNPGDHSDIPAYEGLSWEAFFRRHLSGEGAAGVLQAA